MAQNTAPPVRSITALGSFLLFARTGTGAGGGRRYRSGPAAGDGAELPSTSGGDLTFS